MSAPQPAPAGPGTSGARGGARRRSLAIGLGTLLVVGTALVAIDVTRPPAAAAQPLTAFDDCGQLAAWYAEAALPHVTAYGLDGGPYWAMDDVAVAEAADASVGGAASAGSDGSARTGGPVGSSETGTNVQEAGVDEPSRVKVVDGTAYALAGNRLVLVDLAAGTVLGSVRLAPEPAADGPGSTSFQAWSSDLLLVDGHVVVLGGAGLPWAPAPLDTTEVLPGPGGPGYPGQVPTTTATTVDVSEPGTPTVVDRVEVEGQYVSARAVGGTLRLVTSTQPLLPFVTPWTVSTGVGGEVPQVEPGEAEEAVALERNRQVVEDAGADAWVPDLVERGADGVVTSRTPLDCAAVSHPVDDAGLGTLTVLTIDPAARDTLVDTTAVSTDGAFAYASTDRLYVATTSGGWTWGGGGEQVTTDLHGFDISDPRETGYLGSGAVEGWLLGPWALDAVDGFLRVGTTSRTPDVAVEPTLDGSGGAPGVDDSLRIAPAPQPTDTVSSVVVLAETDSGLLEVGRVDGLGPGEQIRSLRWFGDLAVVVTFRQTDPLYAVDLSDPAAPAVLGELKVTGYSAYLHPLGDGLVLGVGQEAETDGRTVGAKVETYDLRDLAAPTDVDSIVWPDSSSAVEWDSRLFAYLPDARRAVLPLERWSDERYSSGLVQVAVGVDGALAETGSWQQADGGWIGGLAVGDGVVVVLREVWPSLPETVQEDTDQAVVAPQQPQQVLTVLDDTGLGLLASVVLG